jgi:hypothetical protein
MKFSPVVFGIAVFLSVSVMAGPQSPKKPTSKPVASKPDVMFVEK